MATLNELLVMVDQGIDPNFAASLAGLSLAAAAFYAPSAKTIIDKMQDRISEFEILIEKANSQGILGKTNLTNELERCQKTIQRTSLAQKGLIKAFLIFVWFVIYTISIDQMININTAKDLLNFLFSSGDGLPIQIMDVVISCVLLTFAGINLWNGAQGIGEYFKIDFLEERKSLEAIRTIISDSITKNIKTIKKA